MLLALSLLAAVFLAPLAWRELQYQWAGAIAHDEHALNYHWLTSVLLAVLLVLAGRSWASLRESSVGEWDCSPDLATSRQRWWRYARAGRRLHPRPPKWGAHRRREQKLWLYKHLLME
jgi:hypothetical protein